jgi:hypothetical protein
MEAKLCPDGSYVGRSGPNCDFAACPTTPGADSSMTTYTDPTSGISFSYPPTLGTQYINTVDWPPKAQLITEAFACHPAGNTTAQGGKTDSITINGHRYCLTEEVEGAAGSTYTQYAYAFPNNDNTIILTFTLRAPQCANYNKPKQTECKTEEASFNINNVVDQIAQSIVFK